MSAPARDIPTGLRRRVNGDYVVDEWGFDRDFVRLASPLFRVRWTIETHNSSAIPGTGPALLVFNRTIGLSEPFVLAPIPDIKIFQVAHH